MQRPPAMLRPARARARTTPDAARARSRFRASAHGMAARVHDERIRGQQRFDLLEQEGRSPPFAIKRAAGAFSTSAALATSAVSAGIRASLAARPARSSAARAVFVRSRRTAIPALASS